MTAMSQLRTWLILQDCPWGGATTIAQLTLYQLRSAEQMWELVACKSASPSGRAVARPAGYALDSGLSASHK